MSNPDLKLLSKKFPEQDIEWRVQQCGQGKKGPWALIIPYITNRAIMQRLDEAVGPENWKNEFSPSPCGKGYLCGISIKLDGEWVTRWDGAEISETGNIDDVKTTISNSMKRTGVQWGIGRYLYQFEAMFADAIYCDDRYNLLPGYKYQTSKDKKTNVFFGFQWKPKPLEAWALPVTPKQVKAYIGAMENAETNEELKQIFSSAYKLAVSENDDEMVKLFTKAKDEAKERLVSEQQESENKVSEYAEQVISSQIEIIESSTNESSVNALTESAIVKVRNSLHGENLKKAIEAIKKASYNKTQKLKGN